MIFFSRLRNALYHIKNSALAELYPIYYDYIKRHFDGLKKKNQYVSIPQSTDLDMDIWKYSFTCHGYNLSLVDIAFMNVVEKLNIKLNYTTDEHYTYDYKNTYEVVILFKDETIFAETLKEFRKLDDIYRRVQLVEEISNSGFHHFYAEIYNPKAEKFIKVAPYEDKISELITTLIKYYKNAGYKLTDKIFNETLFVPSEEKTSYLIFADSDAMASELSFIIMSNSLAEVIE